METIEKAGELNKEGFGKERRRKTAGVWERVNVPAMFSFPDSRRLPPSLFSRPPLFSPARFNFAIVLTDRKLDTGYEK